MGEVKCNTRKNLFLNCRLAYSKTCIWQPGTLKAGSLKDVAAVEGYTCT